MTFITSLVHAFNDMVLDLIREVYIFDAKFSGKKNQIELKKNVFKHLDIFKIIPVFSQTMIDILL